MQGCSFQSVSYLSPTSCASSFTHTTRQTERRGRLFMYAFIISQNWRSSTALLLLLFTPQRHTLGDAVHQYECTWLPKPSTPRGKSLQATDSLFPAFGRRKPPSFNFARKLRHEKHRDSGISFPAEHLICILSLVARTASSDKIIR